MAGRYDDERGTKPSKDWSTGAMTDAMNEVEARKQREAAAEKKRAAEQKAWKAKRK